jgi:type VI secretion system protein VasG
MPLGRDVIEEIIRLKLNGVGDRLLEKHRLQFGYSDQVVATIADDCTVVQSGARNADTVISQRMLPEISRRLLLNVAEDGTDTHLYVALKVPGEFDYRFSRGEFDMPEAIELPEPEPVPEIGTAEPDITETKESKENDICI